MTTTFTPQIHAQLSPMDYDVPNSSSREIGWDWDTLGADSAEVAHFHL